MVSINNVVKQKSLQIYTIPLSGVFYEQEKCKI